MIEVNIYFTLLPGKDQAAYANLAKAVIDMALEAPGIVEVKGHRNLLNAPQVRHTTVWKSLADWANFEESVEWQEAWAEMNPYLSNIHIEIWGPSPMHPESN